MKTNLKTQLGFAPIVVIILSVVAVISFGWVAYYYQKIKKSSQLAAMESARKNAANETTVATSTPKLPEEPAPLETGKNIGYIVKVYKQDEKQYLEIDYIQWFRKKEAIKAAMQDTSCERDKVNDCAPSLKSCVYVRNNNPKLRVFEIAQDAEITMQTLSDTSSGNFNYGEKINYDKLQEIFIVDAERWGKVPFNIELENSIVKKIAEQYIMPL